MATHKWQDATLEVLAAKFGFEFHRIDATQADAFYVQECLDKNDDALPEDANTVGDAARLLQAFGDGATLLFYDAHGDGGDNYEIENISGKTFEQLCDEVVAYLTGGEPEVGSAAYERKEHARKVDLAHGRLVTTKRVLADAINFLSYFDQDVLDAIEDLSVLDEIKDLANDLDSKLR